METCNGQALVQKIEKTELIGNSLDKINSNFTNLDVAVCELQNQTAWADVGANKLIKVNADGQLAEAISNVDYMPGIPQNLPAGILKRTESGNIGIADSTDFVKPNTNVTFDKVLINNDASIGGSLTCSLFKGTPRFEGEVTFDKNVVAPNYVTFSDSNLKQKIKPLESCLAKLSQINGVEYEWKINSTPDVGVIAQEVQKVLPEAVYNTSTEFLGVTYIKLIPLLIEAVKELKKEVDVLKEELKAKS